MLIKKIIKKITPPFFLDIIRSILYPTIVSYKTYNDAVKACKNQNYESSELIKYLCNKNILFKKEIKPNVLFNLNSLRVIVALHLCEIKKRSLKVIDFGGGGGFHYFVALRLLPRRIKLKWNIVETTTLVNEVKKRKITDKNLHFYDNIENAKNNLNKVDLVFSSGALQYCSNPLNFLKQLTEAKGQYIFITRTPLVNADKDIFSIQVSKLSSQSLGGLLKGYVDKKIIYPITYCSKSKFEKILREKYHIKFMYIETRDAHKVDNRFIDEYCYFCVLKK
jgi:putative methyltransferase (TIGR04325 family)